MSFLYENLAAIFVGLAVSSVAWLFGGTRGDWLVQVAPWLFAFTIEVMFCFPQRRKGENSSDARERVWHDMKKDPLVWLSLGFIALLVVPLANNGLCPNCDRALIAQGHVAEPLVPYIPFCVNRMDHLNVLCWFALALPLMVTVKHTLLKRGKRIMLEVFVWNATAIAVLGFVQSATGAHAPYWTEPSGQFGYFFATFGYPNMAGDFFTFAFGIAVALWRCRCDSLRHEGEEDVEGVDKLNRHYFWREQYHLIPAGVLFFAALNTLSRASIMLVTASAVIYFLHAFISFLARIRKAARVKAGALSMLVLIGIIISATMFAPEKFQHEVNRIGTTEVLDRMTGKRECHSRIALEIWKEHLLFGCGGWGYVHFCTQKMSPKERKNMEFAGTANVHNDYLQFLAEHGLVGFGLLVMIFGALLYPIGKTWSKLAAGVRFMKQKSLPPKPVQIFVMPAPVFCILVAALCTLIHAFGDCPLRAPSILILLFCSLAAAEGFLPVFAKEK